MPPAWTIRSLLAWITRDFQTQGIASPRLDGELFIAQVLGFDRVRLYMEMDRPLSADELAAVRALVVRRRKREPVAYILGAREFYRRSFEVTPAVLIPRPDTETLVERALELLPLEREARVLDLCTGSGAIAVTIAADRPLTSVDATDISQDALAVAARNAERHGVADRVRFHHGDLFAALRQPASYDLIVSNPPYIPDATIATLAPEITLHEPRLALAGGADGLDLVRRLCTESADWLAPGGTLLIEIGIDQATNVAALLSDDASFEGACTHRDLGGVLRVVEAQRRSTGA